MSDNFSVCVLCCDESGTISLTCSHSICNKCCKAVKIGNSVFCADCSCLSCIKQINENVLSLVTTMAQEESWEQIAAKKCSLLSPHCGSVRNESSASPSHPNIEKPKFISADPQNLTRNLLKDSTLLTAEIPLKFLPRNLPKNFFGIIKRVATPNRIYVQVLDEHIELFEKMNKLMQEIYNHSNEEVVSNNNVDHLLSPGQYWAVKLKGVWFRAIIKSIAKQKKVFYLVDTGVVVFPGENLQLQHLHSQFKGLPAQAVRCDLDLLPECKFHDSEICDGFEERCWNPTCLNYLEKLCNKTVLAVLVKRGRRRRKLRGFRDYESSVYVTMYPSEDASSVDEYILEQGWSKQKRSFLTKNVTEIWKLRESHVLSPQNLSLSSQSPQKQLPLIGPSWLYEKPVQVWPSKFKGKVTWVDDSGFIYVHSLEWSSTLVYMRDRLKEAFDLAELNKDEIIPLKNGDSCFVKYQNNWFRAIVEYLKENEARVFFVDYGASETVNVSNIRQKNIFFKVPVQTYKCKLDGVVPTNQNKGKPRWTKSTINLIHDLLINNEFEVRVAVFSPLRIRLIFPGGDMHVADVLVAAGKAKYT